MLGVDPVRCGLQSTSNEVGEFKIRTHQDVVENYAKPSFGVTVPLNFELKTSNFALLQLLDLKQ